MRRLSILAGLAVAVLAVTGTLPSVTPAQAASPQVIADCNAHARLTERYSVSQLRAALAAMPADVKEYTDCYDVIQRQLLAEIGGSNQSGAGSGGSGSGGSFLPTPLIVVLVLLVLGAGVFAAVAIRRRGGGGGSGPSGGRSGPAAGGPDPLDP